MENKGGKRLAGEPENSPAVSGPESAGASPAPAPEKSRARRLWDDYGYMVITLAVVFVLFRVILQLAYVPSSSMETTLPTKSLMVGWRLSYLVADPVPERGDIVTFYSDEQGKLLVKRVIGLPGDRITFRDGYVCVNGEKLEEPYLPAQGITQSGSRASYEVPEGCLFLMGDNRTNSLDCRFFSDPYIPLGKVQGKMLLTISIGSEQSWQGVHWIA